MRRGRPCGWWQGGGLLRAGRKLRTRLGDSRRKPAEKRNQQNGPHPSPAYTRALRQREIHHSTRSNSSNAAINSLAPPAPSFLAPQRFSEDLVTPQPLVLPDLDKSEFPHALKRSLEIVNDVLGLIFLRLLGAETRK